LNTYEEFGRVRPEVHDDSSSYYNLRMWAIDKDGNHTNNLPVHNSIIQMLNQNTNFTNTFCPIQEDNLNNDESHNPPFVKYTWTKEKINYTTLKASNRNITSLLKHHKDGKVY
jgi:hypothetical protein